MSRIKPREERVRPKEERHCSTEWREESEEEWKSGLSWRASWELMLRFSRERIFWQKRRPEFREKEGRNPKHKVHHHYLSNKCGRNFKTSTN